MTEDPAPVAERRWWVGPAFALAYLLAAVAAVVVVIGGATVGYMGWLVQQGRPLPLGDDIYRAIGLGPIAAVTVLQFLVMLAVAVALAFALPLTERGVPRVLTALGVRHVGPRAWLPVAVVLGLTIGLLPSYLAEKLGRWLDLGQQVSEMMGLLATAPRWEAVAMTIVVVLIGPTVEELVYRGYLFTALGLSLPAWATILLTSLIFAGSHLDPMQVIPVFPLGLVMGWLRWQTGGIWAPLLLHVTNNGFAAALSFSADQPAPSELDLPVTVVGTAVAIATGYCAWRFIPREPAQLPD